MNGWFIFHCFLIFASIAAMLWVSFNHAPHGVWWICHWCDWEAPAQRRFFDRDRATREFHQHLIDQHPEHAHEYVKGRR